MPDLHALASLARRQHAAIIYEQALDLGYDSATLTRLCQKGLLDLRSSRIYTLAGAPRTRHQDLVGHVLAAGAGALATADSALGLWCPELELPPVPEIAVAQRCRYRPAGVDVRRSRDLHLAKPTVIDDIPVVGIARALLDAAVGRSVEEVLSRIDACRRHRPVAVGALAEVVHTHARRGRPGIATFRTAVRSLRRVVTDSDFERYVIRDLRQAGISDPLVHHVVRFPGEQPIELDLYWDDALLDVELDGRDHTARARAGRRDRQRDRLLQAAGYRVFRYTWDDYVTDVDGMIAQIAAALA